MHQKHQEFVHSERLVQHAIEVFDLVDITPAATAGKVIDHRFLQSDVLLAATQYGTAERAYRHVAGTS